MLGWPAGWPFVAAGSEAGVAPSTGCADGGGVVDAEVAGEVVGVSEVGGPADAGVAAEGEEGGVAAGLEVALFGDFKLE